jgi:next-to-BRCA1 protein 1
MHDTSPSSLDNIRQRIATAFSQHQGSATAVMDTKSNGETPSVGQALLIRPSGSADSHEIKEKAITPINRSLAALLNDGPSVTVGSYPLTETSVSRNAAVVDKPVAETPLLAAFLEDVTVPDGQIFPPGAEFVKCWRLLNDSERAWPESTELIFAAGESLARDQSISQSVHIGTVNAGTEVELWTGELKVIHNLLEFNFHISRIMQYFSRHLILLEGMLATGG